MRKEFWDYVSKMKEIQELSSPSTDDILSGDDYGNVLTENFRRIGELAASIRETMETVLLPMLDPGYALSDEEKAELSELNELLVDYKTAKAIDQHLSELINERLITDDPVDQSADTEDNEAHIRSLVKTMQIKYYRMITTQHSNPENSELCRAEGLEAFTRLKAFLEKDAYAALPEDSRLSVLYNCLNGALLYQAYTGGNRAFYRKKMMDELKESLSRISDGFYREHTAKADWDGLEARVYDHMSAILLDPDLPADEAKEIYPYMLKYKELTERVHPAGQTEADMELVLFQAAALAGEPSVEKHFEKMLEFYENRDSEEAKDHAFLYKRGIPLTIYECLISGKVHGSDLKEEDYVLLDRIVRNMIEYLGETTRNGIPSDPGIMQSKLMNVFGEHPGGLSFGELCMDSVAALHPPTYVHSNMVARISVCLARHLLRKMPEVFIGFPGVITPNDARNRQDDILDYTYHAALYHDIGKITVLDSIGMYGRQLLNSEFFNIRCHSDNGYRMAIKHRSTMAYGDVIRGHHKYYDNTKGYPEEFDTSTSPYKAIIDIVSVADCLDAATDRVGRSYHAGKTFKDFKGEVSESAGTRYAPYFPKLFEYADLNEDVEYILTKERSSLYREIFLLIKNVNNN